MIRISGGMADVYNPYPMQDFCGINLFSEDAAERLQKDFRTAAKNGRFSGENKSGIGWQEMDPELQEKIENSELVYSDEK